MTEITDIQRQALLYVADCGWGTRSYGQTHMVDLNDYPGEFDELMEAVFGPLSNDDGVLDSGEKVTDLGEALRTVPLGTYVLTRPRRTVRDHFGFDEDLCRPRAIEPGAQIEVLGPLTEREAMKEFCGRTGLDG